jgi:hypothetical protein
MNVGRPPDMSPAPAASRSSEVLRRWRAKWIIRCAQCRTWKRLYASAAKSGLLETGCLARTRPRLDGYVLIVCYATPLIRFCSKVSIMKLYFNFIQARIRLAGARLRVRDNREEYPCEGRYVAPKNHAERFFHIRRWDICADQIAVMEHALSRPYVMPFINRRSTNRRSRADPMQQCPPVMSASQSEG